MADPSQKSSFADNKTAFTDFQVLESGNSFASRLQWAMAKKNWKPAALAEKSGVPYKRVSDYLKGPKVPTAEYLVALTEALSVSAEWLVLGRERLRPALIEVDAADWEWVPRFDLRKVHDTGKGDPIDKTPLRRDWLAKTLGTSSELWLATMLSDYPGSDLYEGELVFCREIEPVELLDGQLILFRVNEQLTVARYSLNAPAAGLTAKGENMITFREVSADQYVPVARILGKFVQRF